MTKIRPFDRQGFYTVFDNYTLDEIMPRLKPTSWKILCLIIRKTIGWNKVSDDISFSQIRKGTGIKSNKTISDGLQELTEFEFGPLIVTQKFAEKWASNRYALNTALEIDSSAKNEPSAKNELESSAKNELGSSVKNEHTKQKKESKKRDYAQDLLLASGNGVESQPTNPVPEDSWFGYREAATRIFDKCSGAWGYTHQERATRKDVLMGFVASQENFNPDIWEQAITESIAAGVNAANLTRFIEVYKVGGSYEVYLQNKYSKDNNNGKGKQYLETGAQGGVW